MWLPLYSVGQRNHEPTQIQEAGTWVLPINEGKGMLKNLWTQKKKKKKENSTIRMYRKGIEYWTIEDSNIYNIQRRKHQR